MADFVQYNGNYPTIDIGRMIHRVTIQSEGAASPPEYDSAGQVIGWGAFTTAWAAIEYVKGTDMVKAGQTITELFLTVGLWYQPGILPNMRVQAPNGSVYRIQSIENVREMNVVLVLNCLGLGPNT